MNLQAHVSKFFDAIESTLGYDRKDLTLEVEIHGHGGPTVRPGNVPDKAVVQKAKSKDGTGLPSVWYDTLGSHHAEFRIVHEKSEGDVTVPRVLYSFQHHTFPGNCRICVNRWVRVLDDVNKWPKELIKAGLDFRVGVAKTGARCSLLVISTGKSFSGAEPKEEYDKLFEGHGRGIYLIETSKHLSREATA